MGSILPRVNELFPISGSFKKTCSVEFHTVPTHHRARIRAEIGERNVLTLGYVWLSEKSYSCEKLMNKILFISRRMIYILSGILNFNWCFWVTASCKTVVFWSGSCQRHAVSRTQQFRQRESTFKSLRSSLIPFFFHRDHVIEKY